MISRSIRSSSILSSATSSLSSLRPIPHNIPSTQTAFLPRSNSLSFSVRHLSTPSTTSAIRSSPPPIHSSPSATLSSSSAAPSIPSYLHEVYWWTYVSERAVWVFERNWLVNLILWGNFKRLSTMALKELKNTAKTNPAEGENSTNANNNLLHGSTLQVACVYGNFTLRLSSMCQSLTVLDVLPVQLANLKKKLTVHSAETNQDLMDRTRLILNDSSNMEALKTNEFDRAVLFFLLHEMPRETRINTIKETFRVMKPGSKLIIVDYHRPNNIFLYKIMELVLKNLEPFAMDLWNEEIENFLPNDANKTTMTKQTVFNGLYQLITIEKKQH